MRRTHGRAGDPHPDQAPRARDRAGASMTRRRVRWLTVAIVVVVLLAALVVGRESSHWSTPRAKPGLAFIDGTPTGIPPAPDGASACSGPAILDPTALAATATAAPPPPTRTDQDQAPTPAGQVL